jgi:hypothetical protein
MNQALLPIFIMGCLGCLAALMVPWIPSPNDHESRGPRWSTVCMWLIVSILGGVVAVILKQSPLWSAFAAGVTMVRLIQALGHLGTNAH